MPAHILSQYQSALRKFVRFAAAHDITALTDVDTDLATAYATAPSRNRGGLARKATTSTQTNRRDALRSFFATAIQAGWADTNPGAGIAVPSRANQTTFRPLTDDEAERVRFLAGEKSSSVRAAAVALQLSGAWAVEITFLRPEAFDPQTRVLSLPGGHERRARTIQLDPEAARVITARLDWLRSRHIEPALLLKSPEQGNPKTQRTYVATQTTQAIKRAGLSAATPASLTLWAAKREFETTGQIEAAARLIGSNSLDLTARNILWDWSTAGGAA